MERIKTWSLQKASRISLDFKRYLWNEINWKNRLIIITGGRGVGKTTMLLQYIKEELKLSDNALYVSMDDIFFSTNSIVSLTEDFVKRGGKYLLLDEVHKYPSWSQEVKNIYDQFPELQIIITGSSTLDILKGEGDLSRRAMIYHLYGLSFREFLLFSKKIHFDVQNLNNILKYNKELSMKISQETKPIKHFEEYLKYGYYPFALEDIEGFSKRLSNGINNVLETDIPSVFNINYEAVVKIRKLLGIIAEMVPFKPNVQKLSLHIGLSRETLIKYLQYLDKADIIRMLYSNTKGISFLNKPEKIYLHNPNLTYAIGTNVNKGNLRETFFLNQTNIRHKVNYTEHGDFIVDDKNIFEIGGKNKKQKQIRNIKNAYIAKDDIEIGFDKQIPLWLFGFLY